MNGRCINIADCHPDLGIIVDPSLKFHIHVGRIIRFAAGLTTNLLDSTLCRDSDFLLNLYITHVRPKLEYGCQLWNVDYIGDMKLLERIQSRWTRAISGVAEMPYSDRLRRLDLFSMKGRLLRADLIYAWKIFNGLCSLSPDDLFIVHPTRNTRGHGLKLFLPRTRLEMRKWFFSVRIVNLWNSLPSETVYAAFLESFKKLLKRDLGDLLFDHYE